MFQTHENLEHLAITERVLGPLPTHMLMKADLVIHLSIFLCVVLINIVLIIVFLFVWLCTTLNSRHIDKYVWKGRLVWLEWAISRVSVEFVIRLPELRVYNYYIKMFLITKL